uniref:RING-type domain-containing protein n=1 Tax=Alexandrium catenella TaxID=2925 RepID=A0A7S1WGD9_ALECA
MLVTAPRHNGMACTHDAPAWHGGSNHSESGKVGNGGSYMRPIEELEGTWMNVDCPREQYVISGLRITRSDARGTRNFTIHWDQTRQRWQWGTHGRLSLQWLGDDAIAWVPDTSWDAEHARVWRWQRCGPSSHSISNEPSGSSYRPWRRSHGQHAEEPYPTRDPYPTRPWRGAARQEESLGDWRSSSARHRDSHHHGHHHSHHRSHHRDHSYGSHHRDRHSGQASHRSDHSRRPYQGTTDMQVNAVLPCGLTPVEVYSLLSREIGPEDYEVLLRLDDSVPKKTASSEGLDRLPNVAQEDFMGGKCSVCLSAFEEDDEVTALQCEHHFHRSCIRTWLSEYRHTCPLCCSEVFPA